NPSARDLLPIVVEILAHAPAPSVPRPAPGLQATLGATHGADSPDSGPSPDSRGAIARVPGRGPPAPLQRLIRIAQPPQDTGHHGPPPQARACTKEEGVGAVRLRVVKGTAQLQVGPSRDKLAKMEQELSQDTVPLQEERRVALALYQGEELFG